MEIKIIKRNETTPEPAVESPSDNDVAASVRGWISEKHRAGADDAISINNLFPRQFPSHPAEEIAF
jgi:hypothetical protein